MTRSGTWRRARFGSLLLPGLAVILLFVGWLAIYAYDRGFSRKWRKFIREEFRDRGVEVEFARLTIDPLQGLVARDVDIFESRKRKLRLASITGIKIDADLIKVASGRNFINSVDLDDVDLLIPLDPDDVEGPSFAVRHLSARMYFLPDRIEVRRVIAEIAGVDVEISGTLPLKATGAAEDSAGEQRRTGVDPKQIRKWRQKLAQLSVWLERISFDLGAPAKLEIQIEGDPSFPEELRGNLRLVTGGVRIGNAEFESASLTMDLRKGELLLRSLELVAGSRRIEAHGRYATETKLATFQVEADGDLPALAASFLPEPGMLGELVFYDAPSISAKGRWDFSRDASERLVFGHFDCDRFASRGMVFAGSMDFSIAPDRFFIRNFRLEHQSGNLTLQCLKKPEHFQYDATLRMDPSALVPFVATDKMRSFLQSFAMGRDAGVHLELSGEGPTLDGRTWQSSGHLDLRDFEFRGTHFDRLEMDLTLDGPNHHYENIRVFRPEGSARGERVSVAFAAAEGGVGIRTELVGLEGNLEVLPVLRCFHPKTAELLQAYRFESPPDFEVAGVVVGGSAGSAGGAPSAPAGQTDLVVKFLSSGPAATDLLGKTWNFSRASGDVRISPAGVEVDLLGSLLGGELRLDCLSTGGTTHGDLRSEGLDFNQVVTLLGGSGQSQTQSDDADADAGGGSLDLISAFHTHANPADWFDAEGQASLREADIFAIPILGPLSPVISALVPGNKKIGYGTANSASIDFTIENGVLQTDAFEATSATFRLGAKGQVDLRTMEVAADATINLKGAAGILLSPMSKLLEFRASGNAKNPKWVPKHLVSPLGGTANLDD